MRAATVILATLFAGCAAPPAPVPPPAWVVRDASGAAPAGRVFLTLEVFESVSTPPDAVTLLDPAQVGSAIGTLVRTGGRHITSAFAFTSPGEEVHFGVLLDPAPPTPVSGQVRGAERRSGLRLELDSTLGSDRPSLRIAVRDDARVLIERALDVDLLRLGLVVLVVPGTERTYVLVLSATS